MELEVVVPSDDWRDTCVIKLIIDSWMSFIYVSVHVSIYLPIVFHLSTQPFSLDSPGGIDIYCFHSNKIGKTEFLGSFQG